MGDPAGRRVDVTRRACMPCDQDRICRERAGQSGVAGLTPAPSPLSHSCPPLLVPEPRAKGVPPLHCLTIRAPRLGACPNPEGNCSVSTLALLVALLLVVVVVLLAAGVAYVVHRHPSWSQPLGAAFGAVAVMATLVGAILAR